MEQGVKGGVAGKSVDSRKSGAKDDRGTQENKGEKISGLRGGISPSTCTEALAAAATPDRMPLYSWFKQNLNLSSSWLLRWYEEKLCADMTSEQHEKMARLHEVLAR